MWDNLCVTKYKDKYLTFEYIAIFVMLIIFAIIDLYQQ
jgi:hypothetical protein